MDVPDTKRIVIVGKSGAGKSSLANTIFGDQVFQTDNSPKSGTTKCKAVTKSVNGRRITLIDTPGLFDTNKSEEELKPEIVRCITECAPGPHAFLIVFKVDRFTEQEQDVINRISQYFSEAVLKYAVILFTHGDQLDEGKKIEDFVSQSEDLSDLVKKCGNRCHVIDNKYWKKTEQDEYRSNKFQVAELLNTFDKIVKENNGGCYTNEMLQKIERDIQNEETTIRQTFTNMSQEEVRNEAKKIVSASILIQLTGIGIGMLFGGLLGVPAMVTKLVEHLQSPKAVAVTLAKDTMNIAVNVVRAGYTGYCAVKDSKSTKEAAEKAIEAVMKTMDMPRIQGKEPT
ncbi:GTPase IMAP family member 7-like [Seriola dumerili]|uniref:GTPase IMAP family member 7-like n=1 Tax=Seriola dumerili TaxID=41447 RepID=UPI000BBE72C7|nr:GTPase IMAP family member 7-like [Seriola dumerili]